MIETAKKRKLEEDKPSADLLSLLLNAIDNPEEGNFAMNDEILRENLVLFFIAGKKKKFIYTTKKKKKEKSKKQRKKGIPKQ